MRNKLIPLVLGAAVAGLLLAQPAAAQDRDKGDVSFGYQFLSLSANDETESMPAGWFVDVAGNLNRSVAVVAQFGGNYKSLSESIAVGGVTASANADIRLHQFMGGVRVSAHPSTTVVPFVHVLAGASYGSVSYSGTGSIAGQTVLAVSGADSGTNFALQAGGGTNIWMTRTVGLRIGVDYVRVFETDAGANVFRFGAGVGFKF
jgi:hypothetical protein